MLILVSIALYKLVTVTIIYSTSESANSNVIAMVTGFWSAGATAALGGIAIWQNMRYKRLSEKMTDLINMPEFYRVALLGELLDSMDKARYNGLTIQPDSPENCKKIECGIFFPLKPPILNMRPYCLRIGKDCIIKNFAPNNDGFSLCNEDIRFTLCIMIPDKYLQNDYEYTLTMLYENIFGTTYMKNLNFYVHQDCQYAVNWKLDKAKRKEL